MKKLKEAKFRAVGDDRTVRDSVTAIIDDVRSRGDDAVRDWCRKFDGTTREVFRISREEIEAAKSRLPESFLDDLRQARDNIRAFAEAQRGTITEVHDFSPQPGIFLSDRDGKNPLFFPGDMTQRERRERDERKKKKVAPGVEQSFIDEQKSC